MLSRLGSRCRAYPEMKTFDQTLDLFLSTARANSGKRRRGGRFEVDWL